MNDQSTDNFDVLHRALAWQVLMGADEAVGDMPVDRTQMKVSEKSAAVTEQPLPMTKSAAPAANKVMPIALANANTLEELEQQLRQFEGLSIKKSAMNLVFGKGNPDADILFIGEAPGADEDRQGKPFVGISGQLLDRAKAAIGLDDTNTYTTNVIYWRPPGNRKPTPQETAVILPFVMRHIELIDPKFIVLLGDSACKTLLAKSEGITKLRGRWFDYQSPGLSHPVPTLATFHPAYLLRAPGQKALLWRDLLSLKEKWRALDSASLATSNNKVTLPSE